MKTTTRQLNVFAVGLDKFNLKLLQRVRHPERYEFHGLLDYDRIVSAKRFDMEALLDEARQQLDAFDGPIDAIVGYWDFPTVAMMAVLRREYGLRGPSLESVLRCDHKFWSRSIQREVVPDMIPEFAAVDPWDEQSGGYPETPLDFPFWMKPVKAHSSILGFKINDRQQFEEAIQRTRRGLKRFAEPFDVLLSYADLPPSIDEMGGWACIAEGLISKGNQCTLEGYVFEGDVVIYGIVDSLRGPNGSSFHAYQYPSRLSESVRDKMCQAATSVIERIELDDTPFNIEFYHHEKDDSIHLLEINARISKSHSPLFNKVEGVPHKEVMLDVALGKRPDYPTRNGDYQFAAKFMPRIYDPDDSDVIQSLPSESELRAVEESIDGVEIQLLIDEGTPFGESSHRDSYSVEIANIFVGASSPDELHDKFQSVLDTLKLQAASGAPIE